MRQPVQMAFRQACRLQRAINSESTSKQSAHAASLMFHSSLHASMHRAHHSPCIGTPRLQLMTKPVTLCSAPGQHNSSVPQLDKSLSHSMKRAVQGKSGSCLYNM